MKTALIGALLLAVPPSAPAAPGPDFSEVARRMQAFVDDGTIAGAVTLVARRERVLWQKASGLADLGRKRPMRTDDLFWIASMTKPMTAVAILMLQDEGKLSITDPVEKFLPEFEGGWLIRERAETRMLLERPERPITLRDLLTHSAGLSDMRAPRPDSSLAELVVGYARQPRNFSPGEKWEYSNPSINTLGRVVEVVAGRPFAEFLQARLLAPLKMKDTTFWPTAAQLKRLAKSYRKPDGDGPLEETGIPFITSDPADRRRTPLPAGGLFSTAQDVLRFYQFMLNDGVVGKNRLLSHAAVTELTRTQSGELKTGFTDGMSWGLGFQVVREPQGVTRMLSPGTFGHGGAYATQSWADPVKDLIFILMIQRAGFPNGDASPVREAFQAAAVQALGDP